MPKLRYAEVLQQAQESEETVTVSLSPFSFWLLRSVLYSPAQLFVWSVMSGEERTDAYAAVAQAQYELDHPVTPP